MKKMLIDATSQSEIRLAVVNDQKLENYEFEPRPTKYTKGNIYLAKVIRVEPSLQAAFVEYADKTQGFLPFSEIHPDYFKIPVEDYEALMAEQREQRRLAAEAEEASESEEEEAQKADSDTPAEEGEAEEVKAEKPKKNKAKDNHQELDDDGERPLVFTPKMTKLYKIQEVIKQGQLMLVQVTKEERGNKRAALSTYMALAGCYCVLIPNALFNGGVSRKIDSSKERKRLKKILAGLEIPDGMALILRTAAEGKTKASLNREVKYLQKFWGDLRDKTMNSVAPLMIHEEGDLINRSLRDTFSKQIEEVRIAGKDAYKQAKEFTKMLNPKLSRSLKEFVPEGQENIFESHGLERELQSLVQSEVPMASGGALVIEQTEALVSIDVNSGRAISERNIEETALKTNLEAADEVARQLRLRNLAGLIVIDFIDMDRRGNQQKVEKQLKAALKNDKARLHVGRISNFGLLEMSRQRLGPSIQEKTTTLCPHCQGHGHVMNQEGMVAGLLRALSQRMAEIAAQEKQDKKVTVHCLARVAQLLLNEHLQALQELEERHGLKVVFEIVAELRDIQGWSLDGVQSQGRERGNKRRGRKGGKDKNQKNTKPHSVDENAETDKTSEDGGRKKRRRRNRKSADTVRNENEVAPESETTETPIVEEVSAPEVKAETAEEKTKPKRKPRGRKPKKVEAEIESASESEPVVETPAEPVAEVASSPKPVAPEPTPEPAPAADEPVRGKPQPDATAEIKPKRKGWWNLLS